MPLKQAFAAAFMAGQFAEAAITVVSPEDDFQEILDNASPGDGFRLLPGVYKNEDLTSKYGFRVSVPNIIITGTGDGRTKIVYNDAEESQQDTGLYAAPRGDGSNCEFDLTEGCPDILDGFVVKGLSVEGFPGNGIQTRWVENFVVQNCESIDNLRNGLYLTISSHGLVKNSKSTGSFDSALWVAGSTDVNVTGTELAYSTTGFEVTVSADVDGKNNYIHDNTVGIGLYHPNMAGTDEENEGNWHFQNNRIHNNNLPNPAPVGSFSSYLPSGIGVLVVGVSDNLIERNAIQGNNYAGIAVGGLCTLEVLAFPPDYQCFTGGGLGLGYPINGEPSADRNLIHKNRFSGNGQQPPGGLNVPVPGVDIIFASLPDFAPFESGDDNCFSHNIFTGQGNVTFFSTTVDGSLPSGGCSFLG
mmetsp:Transcript_13879/g.30126  ORF Transcript_13879/g.30126 Transcript_13879/m.30126 type:complete len:415 (-) Transcript_13879:370-1614(-)|eukprot:CAMPEP_0172554840 /NCGR_PEP_ID=MMETSP1067-20121228/56658_1 /TAXON_ID=265564 ORGANISM="Thalassiosira punctigera, Strain Tpunct2005C2" /NCGR_SAMPLE_ID=MMETSP1067 /ASSEMBLY_ACC=CAM_ASM_000444 /LENGTH=414 /DNA_ID=CAMNT_0013343287 /DNA_START=152 /DNA_END=1396 /DNA_ORIENTATION=-